MLTKMLAFLLLNEQFHWAKFHQLLKRKKEIGKFLQITGTNDQNTMWCNVVYKLLDLKKKIKKMKPTPHYWEHS